MKPGRELDALIAEKVMGGIRHKEHSVLAVDVSARSFTIGEGWEYPRYSTDIAAAWEVVEKIIKEWRLDKPGRNFKISRRLEGWECEITSDFIGNSAEVNCSTAPHAICLAALKAVEK